MVGEKMFKLEFLPRNNAFQILHTGFADLISLTLRAVIVVHCYLLR